MWPSTKSIDFHWICMEITIERIRLWKISSQPVILVWKAKSETICQYIERESRGKKSTVIYHLWRFGNAIILVISPSPCKYIYISPHLCIPFQKILRFKRKNMQSAFMYEITAWIIMSEKILASSLAIEQQP